MKTDRPTITYNGVIYAKHPKQAYYYCNGSVGKRQYSRSLHRQMWYDAYGKIPEGYVIHHKNHDSTDNRLENFECISGSEHQSYHMKKRVEENPEWFQDLAELGRQFAPEWHKSEEGKEWHRQHAKNFNFGKPDLPEQNCEVCKKEFKPKKYGAKFCSNNCKSTYRRRSGVDDVEKTCVVCGSTFVANKYALSKSCSRKCGNQLRTSSNHWTKK